MSDRQLLQHSVIEQVASIIEQHDSGLTTEEECYNRIVEQVLNSLNKIEWDIVWPDQDYAIGHPERYPSGILSRFGTKAEVVAFIQAERATGKISESEEVDAIASLERQRRHHG